MATLEELETRVRDLEARLRAAEDVQAITRMKARYGALADSRYTLKGVKPAEEVKRIAAEIAALFAEDAVWDGGPTMGVARGRNEIRKRFEEPTLEFSWHYFVQPEIQVEGDTASATWEILAPCTVKGSKAFWMAGAEDDTYRRESGVWLHTGMKLRSTFFAPFDKGWAR
jgi:ketosteroid isomerase-like protein